MTRKSDALAIQESIRRILFDDWDAIGVNNTFPRDEYDAYIAGVYRLLISGASEDALIEHLGQVEISEITGTATSLELRRRVAKKLLKLNCSLSK